MATQLTLIITRYSNGELREKFWVKDRMMHGLYTLYYMSGKPQLKCTFRYGRREGIYTEFDSYGKRIKKVNMYNNKYDGEFISYSWGGGVKVRCQYVNGKKHGKEYVVGDNNETYMKYYKNGIIDGYDKCYFYGALESSYSYIHGVQDGIYKKYFYHRTMICTLSYYVDCMLEGEHFEYHSNGQLFNLTYYKFGRKNGIYKEYDLSGCLIEETCYKDNVKNGKQTSYISTEGSIDNIEYRSVCYFRNNKPDGEVVIYMKNSVKFHSRKVNDKLEGITSSSPQIIGFNLKGCFVNERKYGTFLGYDNIVGRNVRIKQDFIDNQKDGITKRYYEDGMQLRQIIMYTFNREFDTTTYFNNGKPSEDVKYITSFIRRHTTYSPDGKITDIRCVDMSSFRSFIFLIINPKICYRKEKMCYICRSKKKKIFELSCGHTFHYKCLNTWFTNSKQVVVHCPYCMKEIEWDNIKMICLSKN